MIDRTDLVSLETDVRSLIGEEVAKFWTQDRVFRAINAEVLRLCRKIISLDNGYLEQIYTATAATTITLPLNCYIVRNVELYQNDVWVSPKWINDHARGQYQVGSGTSNADAVQFYDGSITFESGIGSASSCRIKYARLPAAMFYQTLAGGSATTAVLGSGSVIDDVYIGDRFVVLEGTGLGQLSTVSDYVASTLTCTIASGATLDNTTVVSTLLPEPLAKWPDLVACGAALRLLSRNRDADRYQMIQQDYQMDMTDMVESLSQRQTEQARHGNYLPQGDE